MVKSWWFGKLGGWMYYSYIWSMLFRMPGFDNVSSYAAFLSDALIAKHMNLSSGRK